MEEEEDDDGSEEATASQVSSGDLEVAAAAQATKNTPILDRLRHRMAWGTTTKEEKRSLYSKKHKRKQAQRQSNIGVPTDLLLQALKARLDDAGEEASHDDVAELSALLRLQLRHELMESSLWIVDAFDILSAEGSNSATTPKGSAEGGGGGSFGGSFGGDGSSSAAELDGLSDRFIDGLCALMQRGHYRTP